MFFGTSYKLRFINEKVCSDFGNSLTHQLDVILSAAKDLWILTFLATRKRGHQIGSIPSLAQIDPRGVLRLDQCDLPFPLPPLDLLFEGYCGTWPLKLFQPHQPVAIVFRGKPEIRFRLVLKDTTMQMPSHTHIKCMATTRHDVDEIAAFLHGKQHTVKWRYRKAESRKSTADPSLRSG